MKTKTFQTFPSIETVSFDELKKDFEESTIQRLEKVATDKHEECLLESIAKNLFLGRCLIPLKGKYPYGEFLPKEDGKSKWGPLKKDHLGLDDFIGFLEVSRDLENSLNYGVVTGWGDNSGKYLTIVDVDQEEKLPSDLKPLTETLPETFQVKTGRGHHFYFYTEEPIGIHQKFSEGEERNEIAGVISKSGKYVVGPHSIHKENNDFYSPSNQNEIAFVPNESLSKIPLFDYLGIDKTSNDQHATASSNSLSESSSTVTNTNNEGCTKEIDVVEKSRFKDIRVDSSISEKKEQYNLEIHFDLEDVNSHGWKTILGPENEEAVIELINRLLRKYGHEDFITQVGDTIFCINHPEDDPSLGTFFGDGEDAFVGFKDYHVAPPRDVLTIPEFLASLFNDRLISFKKKTHEGSLERDKGKMKMWYLRALFESNVAEAPPQLNAPNLPENVEKNVRDLYHGFLLNLRLRQYDPPNDREWKVSQYSRRFIKEWCGINDNRAISKAKKWLIPDFIQRYEEISHPTGNKSYWYGLGKKAREELKPKTDPIDI